ncbi:MAG TPA: hypothetical protein VL549_02200 [Gemmatimonadales bacterium]|jgi:hypothetical protein|nr:hypothetical protein [Gemmatimonadales bacterium]
MSSAKQVAPVAPIASAALVASQADKRAARALDCVPGAARRYNIQLR